MHCFVPGGAPLLVPLRILGSAQSQKGTNTFSQICLQMLSLHLSMCSGIFFLFLPTHSGHARPLCKKLVASSGSAQPQDKLLAGFSVHASLWSGRPEANFLRGSGAEVPPKRKNENFKYGWAELGNVWCPIRKTLITFRGCLEKGSMDDLWLSLTFWDCCWFTVFLHAV